MTIPYAAGGLYSTIEDLYHWDQALYTEQLVSQELLNLMVTPHAKIPDSDLSYGYGWVIGQMNNHHVVGHGGGIEGFATDIRRYPDGKVTVIILSNRDTTDVGTVADQSAQAVFGERPPNTACTGLTLCALRPRVFVVQGFTDRSHIILFLISSSIDQAGCEWQASCD